MKWIRHELLDAVHHSFQGHNQPWMLAGDFNIIVDSGEKRGGQNLDSGAMHDFQNFIHQNGLVDMGFIGDIFTWCNNRRGHARIRERLDRVLGNLEAQDLFPSCTVSHLPRITSDHSPLLVRWEVEVPQISAGFIFQRMWVDHKDFKKLVAMDWAKPVPGTPGLKFWRKLLRPNHTLKRWNWNGFEDIFKKKAELTTKIQTFESQLQGGWSENTHKD